MGAGLEAAEDLGRRADGFEDMRSGGIELDGLAGIEDELAVAHAPWPILLLDGLARQAG